MIVIVALSVTLLCGFISNMLMLEKRVNTLFHDANIWDVNVYTTALLESDHTFFDNLENVEVEYRFFADGTMNNVSAKIFLGDNSISKPVIVEGVEGVLIDSTFASSRGYAIGDIITIDLLDYDESLELEITGLMRFAEVTSTKTTCPVYISLASQPSLSPLFQAYHNQVLIQTDDVSLLKQQALTHFQGQNNLLFIYEKDTMESYALLDTEVSQSRAMIIVFPVIFLIVSILVILTTISQLILRERTNIGTLKALGYGDFTIGMHYSSVGIIISMLGAFIGAILGPQIIPHVMSIKYQLIYNLPNIPVIYSLPMTLLTILGFGILSSVISIVVCHDVIKENPAKCMRPKVPQNKLLIRLIGDDLDD